VPALDVIVTAYNEDGSENVSKPVAIIDRNYTFTIELDVTELYANKIHARYKDAQGRQYEYERPIAMSETLSNVRPRKYDGIVKAINEHAQELYFTGIQVKE
jgi:hypothetical protein